MLQGSLVGVLEGRRVGPFGNVDADRIRLARRKVVVLEGAPEAASLDPHNRIGEGVEILASVEGGQGDVVGLDSIRAAFQRLFDHI
jgi:hypothetical protein